MLCVIEREREREKTLEPASGNRVEHWPLIVKTIIENDKRCKARRAADDCIAICLNDNDLGQDDHDKIVYVISRINVLESILRVKN